MSNEIVDGHWQPVNESCPIVGLCIYLTAGILTLKYGWSVGNGLAPSSPARPPPGVRTTNDLHSEDIMCSRSRVYPALAAPPQAFPRRRHSRHLGSGPLRQLPFILQAGEKASGTHGVPSRNLATTAYSDPADTPVQAHEIMHQHPRPSPITASPASSPRADPARTNKPREEGSSSGARLAAATKGYSEADEGSGDSGEIAASGPSRDVVKKLDQIIQNFHTKAAYLVLQSRMPLPVVFSKDGTKKLNKWFQIETDDTSAFKDDLSLWKSCGGYQNRPLPLVIETFIDTSNLTKNQSLVLVDDQGKRWDVLEALSNSSGSRRNTEVILERWKIELQDSPGERTYDFGSTLPTVYKKCIVFFRSLYATTKFVPAWRFVKSLAKSGSSSGSLRVSCRILSGDAPPSRFDALTHPIYELGGPVTTDYELGTTETPVGQFSAEVEYRIDCNFRVDDSEALLSSRFMGADEHFFQPSLNLRGDNRRGASRTAEVGSLPAHRQQRNEDPEPIQAYGSLSTFHGDAPHRGSSPISALRAAKTMGSDTSSPSQSSAPKSRPMQTSKASLVQTEGIQAARRPSVSFQPFKAGPLSSSPGLNNPLQYADPLPQSPQSLPRGGSGISSALSQARNRSSLIAGMPATLRGGPVAPPDNVVTSSTSSSPRPASLARYSSSFTHRRGRSSYGGASKIVDDEQGSSGKQSLSSSVQPSSGLLADSGAADAGSDSQQTDDDNISDFLKLLDSKKTLQSFEQPGEAATKRTSAQLSKFQSMRESNNALTESMSSSTLLHRSSISSSRQLSSVPPMVAATSMSVSSSPGKPVSPHTPHTPAIPSRLSANSIADYHEPRGLSYQSRAAPTAPLEGVGDGDGPNEIGTIAIDIPTSPRTYYPHARRSSSVAQQHRSEEDLGDLPFGTIHRSISLGADDRGEAPSISALLGMGQAVEHVASASSPSPSRLLHPAPHMKELSTAMSSQPSSPLEAHDPEAPPIPRGQSAGSMNSPYRLRLGRTGGRGFTPPTASSSSLIERGSGSGTSERANGRNSFTRTPGAYELDDELLFDMSEIGRDISRKSLEDNRGGGSAGTSDRGGYEGQRGGDSGSSSRRGSRRGW
ncbi:autophagy protein Atg [Marssonina coronariae]|uniref:Autophagy-related protein 13 n=1 Tax=Diplocarpon coronariae TaxID=2795749 RepID=A0A218YSV1_9HELO|nr:autophagy protein Atg [Marssonina coronariae]